jgi:hypothetical protein
VERVNEEVKHDGGMRAGEEEKSYQDKLTRGKEVPEAEVDV